MERPPLPPETIEWIRRTRRHPKPTQPDYLVLRRLVQNLAVALGGLAPDAEILDVFCGTRPYEDLLPAGVKVTGYDVDNHYASADVTSPDFLPFSDASFDAIVFTEGFFYLADPIAGASELLRVVRPGGQLVLTLPLVWEYRNDQLEHRFTGPELASIFDGPWEQVQITDVGGYAVSWSLLTGRILRAINESATARLKSPKVVKPLFTASCLAMNGVAFALDRFERRFWRPAPYTFPPDLLLTARRPGG